MIDLERRVLDPEVIVQHGLQVLPRPVAVVVGAHEHVRGQRREAGGDLPDVQVVDLVDAADARPSRRPPRRRRCSCGAASRKIRPESRSSDHAARSITAATNSDAMPSARLNPVTSTTAPAIAVAMNATRSVRTCWNAPSTFSDVRSAPCRIDGGDDVDHHADQGDHQHDPALDLRRLDQPPDALVDDQQAEHEQRRAVELGREDLGALEPVGQRALGRPRRQPQRDQRERQRAPRR